MPGRTRSLGWRRGQLVVGYREYLTPTQVPGGLITEVEPLGNPSHEVTTAGESSASVGSVTSATGLSTFDVPPCSSVNGSTSSLPILHQEAKASKVTHLSRPASELVAELRVGDAYELAGPLPDAAAAQLGHAVLGDDPVHHVLEGRNRRARV
jgi:hypothetical protein